ncbi:MAG TPA: DUF4446 family protein [Candidatus Aquicultor sp.]|jgi:hypothetical protein
MEAINGSLVATISAAGWLILAIWILVISIRVGKITTREKAIAQAGENGDFVGAVKQSLTEFTAVRTELDAIKSEQVELSHLLQRAVQRVGVVRFDAFEDTGGKLSFAAALLDNNGDGMVICAINGRQESRCYAKMIRQGDSEYNLSGEERQAISQALGTVPNRA